MSEEGWDFNRIGWSTFCKKAKDRPHVQNWHCSFHKPQKTRECKGS